MATTKRTNVTTKSINQIVRKLNQIKKQQSKIRFWFFRYSMNWIKDKANSNLNKRTRRLGTSNARQWNLKIYDTYAILENVDENSAAIEFGIGIKGQENKNDKAINDPRLIASENGYQYNIPTNYKDITGGWRFQLPNGQFIYTHGYGGKSFLYDALMEYKLNHIYNEMYEKAFDKVMKSISKKKG